MTTTVPCDGSVVLVHTLPPSLLGISLPFRVLESDVSSFKVNPSSTATGTALGEAGVTPLIVMVIFAVDVSPSLSVMV